MGAGGPGSFQNDDALDWVYDLMQAKDTSFIEKTLQVVIRGDRYLEAPQASVALAAAEVAAALGHAGSPDLPDEVKQWVSRHPSTSSSITQLALQAIQRIKTKSELKDLWDETQSGGDWYAVINDLEARLKRSTAAP